MLNFDSAAEEEATLELFDLCLHARRLDLEASETTFKRILQALELEELHNWVWSFNPSAGAPYHGGIHESLMACYSFMGAAYHNLSWLDMRTLVAAACFHDYNHTGMYAVQRKHTECTPDGPGDCPACQTPATDDSINIERALNGLYEFEQLSKTLSPIEVAIVSRLIACTRYPHLTEPIDLLEQIIRDADFCMPYVSSPIREQLFVGLRDEIAASGRVYTLEAFADGVAAFYQSSARHTGWANAYAEKHNIERSLQDLSAKLRMAECKSSTAAG